MQPKQKITFQYQLSSPHVAFNSTKTLYISLLRYPKYFHISQIRRTFLDCSYVSTVGTRKLNCGSVRCHLFCQICYCSAKLHLQVLNIHHPLLHALILPLLQSHHHHYYLLTPVLKIQLQPLLKQPLHPQTLLLLLIICGSTTTMCC